MPRAVEMASAMSIGHVDRPAGEEGVGCRDDAPVTQRILKGPSGFVNKMYF